MRLVWTVVLSLILVGCGNSRAEQSQTQEQTRTVVGPIQIDTPVGVVTSRPVEVRQTRQEQTTSTAETKYQMELPPEMSAAGGSLLSLIPGVGGMLAAGWALMGRQKAISCLKATVDGIEDAKTTMPKDQIENLHLALSRKMDATHKTLVRKVKV